LFGWISPEADPSGHGYHGLQATIAIGSGGWWGKGWGGGTQVSLAFLPEKHTDFIFSSLGEEFGFVGLVLLLSILVLILWRLLRWADEASGERKLLIYGVFSYVFIQVFFNVLMNLGWLPVVGVTLPLVSYGGSSLISVLAALGLAQSARNRNTRESGLRLR